MNETLLKSYDIIMDQQNKMDNKAYVFLGFIAFIFSFLCPDLDNFKLNTVIIYLFCLAVPLFFSLLPVATSASINIMLIFHNFIESKNKKKRDNGFNIFYYLDIYHVNEEAFLDLFKKNYGYSDDKISLADKKLIYQILMNARILRVKVMFHFLFQVVLFLIVISNILSFIAV